MSWVKAHNNKQQINDGDISFPESPSKKNRPSPSPRAQEHLNFCSDLFSILQGSRITQTSFRCHGKRLRGSVKKAEFHAKGRGSKSTPPRQLSSLIYDHELQTTLWMFDERKKKSKCPCTCRCGRTRRARCVSPNHYWEPHEHDISNWWVPTGSLVLHIGSHWFMGGSHQLQRSEETIWA